MLAFKNLFSPTAGRWPLTAWLKRNLTLILIAAAIISAIFTYSAMTGSSAPLALKPRRVGMLLILNGSLLVLIVGIFGMRIFGLWTALKAGSAGSQLQKRILILFSIVAITPTIIVSIFSALFFNLGIQTWFNDPAIFDLIQDEYKRGYYRGIGEFHLSGKAAATEWVKKTVDFAVAHDLYLHAHADDEAVEILMRHNPRAKIIWAHTGFGLSSARVAAMLATYPQLWGELSYRSGITANGGGLTPEWRGLFEKYPDRFLLGSDTWISERWATYGAIMAEYRGWLKQLPPDVAAKIAHGNARRLFAEK